EGRTLGRHQGIHRYTVGQRKGLGVTATRPRYVLAVLPASRTVVVGSEEELLTDRLTAREVTWLSIPPPTAPVRARVKIRYRHEEAPATVEPLAEGRVEVRFGPPQRAV